MNLPKFYSKKLKNGLEVVAIPVNKGSDVISVNVVYKVGSRNEVMGKTGIAHMLEHMNFKSTKNMKEGEFDQIVKSLGALDNAFTSFDYTQYYIKSSSRHLETDLSLFADVMENLSLKDEEFQRERKVVYEERLWRTDNNPMGYLYFRLFNNAYIYHPYHWTPIGFKDDILNWSIEDIKEFHKTYYQPKNAIIVVAGDIDSNEVFKVVEKHFAKIKNRKEEIPEPFQKEPKLDGDKDIIIEKDSEVEMVAVAYQIGDFRDKDIVALNALSEILGDGESSLFNRKLKYQKELVAQLYCYPMENKDSGLFIIIAICNPGVDGEVVVKEIKKIMKSYKVTKKELEKVKLNDKYDFITSLESSSGVAEIFASYFARGDITPLLEYEDRLNSLTKEDLEGLKHYFEKSISLVLRGGKKGDE